MGFFRALFGGTDTSAQDKTVSQNDRSFEAFQEGQQKATDYVSNLFPAAQSDLSNAFQSAANINTMLTPLQIGATQKANTAAQQAHLSGLGLQNRALLGQPIDYSALSVGNNPVNLPTILAATPDQHYTMPTASAFDFSTTAPVASAGLTAGGPDLSGLSAEELEYLQKLSAFNLRHNNQFAEQMTGDGVGGAGGAGAGATAGVGGVSAA